MRFQKERKEGVGAVFLSALPCLLTYTILVKEEWVLACTGTVHLISIRLMEKS